RRWRKKGRMREKLDALTLALSRCSRERVTVLGGELKERSKIDKPVPSPPPLRGMSAGFLAEEKQDEGAIAPGAQHRRLFQHLCATGAGEGLAGDEKNHLGAMKI
ncbi:hypothetical protein JXO59_15120, partial [candidate division KSB1 bacterium]|nr:hypothetical protein [candidate division KSB1 bacterium]